MVCKSSSASDNRTKPRPWNLNPDFSLTFRLCSGFKTRSPIGPFPAYEHMPRSRSWCFDVIPWCTGFRFQVATIEIPGGPFSSAPNTQATTGFWPLHYLVGLRYCLSELLNWRKNINHFAALHQLGKTYENKTPRIMLSHQPGQSWNQ